MEYISYPPATIAGQATASSVSHTTETDLLKITDPRFLEKAQLTVYIKQTLSTATKVSYGYYVSYDAGTTWYKIPVKDLTTNKGALVDIPSYVDTGSPTQGSAVQTVEDIPIPGANAFKVTGLAATNDAGAVTITALVRDN